MLTRVFFLCLVLAFALTPPALAEEWYEHYLRAEKALAREEWTEASRELGEALGKKSDSGGRARTYGMNVVAYFPYWKMGMAFHGLKELDKALQALETEERLGVIQKFPKSYREFQDLRARVERDRVDAVAEQGRRVRQVVEQSLEDARSFEEAGQLDQAIETLGSALAADPEDPRLLAALQRIQQELDQRRVVENLEARRRRLVAQGSEYLRRQSYDEAARSFQQALDLGPDDLQVKSLLEQSRAGLREKLAVGGVERSRKIAEALDEARNLEAAGDPAAALGRLQTVIALDPTHQQAQSLQSRLLELRSRQEAESNRNEAVETLLGEASRDLDAGRPERCLSAALRALALDRENAVAHDLVSKAYQKITQDLLSLGMKENVPPAILFARESRTELPDGSLVERVQSPDFLLGGVVIDEFLVRDIAFYADEDPLLGEASQGRGAGNQYLTDFSLRVSLEPGPTRIRVVVTDREGASAMREYAVFYEPPFHRRPTIYLGAVILASILLLGWILRRVHLRRRLLHRRFNPYVAGAPILDESLFFGRQRLLDQILQTIHNNSLLLYGERRIGKTSLQHQLKKRLLSLQDPVYEFFPVYVDLQGTPQEKFFATLAEDVFTELAESLDGLESLASIDSDQYSYRDLVRDLRRVVEKLTRTSTKHVKVVLLIDEVDELNYYDPKVNQKLRSLFMKNFAENLVAVVSGVAIKKQWATEGSPWYNFFEEIEVTSIGDEHARELIERPIRGVFKIEPGVVDHIILITESKPYLIQKLLMALVSRMYEEGRRTITISDVEAIGGRI